MPGLVSFSFKLLIFFYQAESIENGFEIFSSIELSDLGFVVSGLLKLNVNKLQRCTGLNKTVWFLISISMKNALLQYNSLVRWSQHCQKLQKEKKNCKWLFGWLNYLLKKSFFFFSQFLLDFQYAISHWFLQWDLFGLCCCLFL